jgi:hypothetical protein
VVKVRIRELILVVAVVPVLGLSLTACGGDDGKKDAGSDPTRLVSPTASLTEVTIPCKKFEGAAKKIVEAQTDLYSGKPGSGALESLVDELDDLKAGAPDDVKRALTNLAAAFEDAQQLLENPTAADRAELASLGEKLSEDGQKVTAYITSKC